MENFITSLESVVSTILISVRLYFQCDAILN